jgi:ABC-type transport system involved in cytochrome c biogenesis permease subunit
MALLIAGIFVGAVWANVSWGRYWGWDPKEVWALITLMIYALPLHQGSLPFFRRPVVFHRYLAIAFLTVLTTYFGVNLLLGGMHSYAG